MDEMYMTADYVGVHLSWLIFVSAAVMGIMKSAKGRRKQGDRGGI
ncbi:hypothetical protein [Paenibacillus lutrae]|nr:hypothetical protein [Paenibacillus lutrae]